MYNSSELSQSLFGGLSQSASQGSSSGDNGSQLTQLQSVATSNRVGLLNSQQSQLSCLAPSESAMSQSQPSQLSQPLRLDVNHLPRQSKSLTSKSDVTVTQKLGLDIKSRLVSCTRQKGDQDNKYHRLSEDRIYDNAVTFFKNYRQLCKNSTSTSSTADNDQHSKKLSVAHLSGNNLYETLPELSVAINKFQAQLEKFDGVESWKEQVNKLLELSTSTSDKQEVLSKMNEMSDQLKVHSKMLQSLLDEQENKSNGGYASISQDHRSCQTTPSLTGSLPNHIPKGISTSPIMPCKDVESELVQLTGVTSQEFLQRLSSGLVSSSSNSILSGAPSIKPVQVPTGAHSSLTGMTDVLSNSTVGTCAFSIPKVAVVDTGESTVYNTDRELNEGKARYLLRSAEKEKPTENNDRYKKEIRQRKKESSRSSNKIVSRKLTLKGPHHTEKISKQTRDNTFKVPVATCSKSVKAVRCSPRLQAKSAMKQSYRRSLSTKEYGRRQYLSADRGGKHKLTTPLRSHKINNTKTRPALDESDMFSTSFEFSRTESRAESQATSGAEASSSLTSEICTTSNTSTCSSNSSAKRRLIGELSTPDSRGTFHYSKSVMITPQRERQNRQANTSSNKKVTFCSSTDGTDGVGVVRNQVRDKVGHRESERRRNSIRPALKKARHVDEKSGGHNRECSKEGRSHHGKRRVKEHGARKEHGRRDRTASSEQASDKSVRSRKVKSSRPRHHRSKDVKLQGRGETQKESVADESHVSVISMGAFDSLFTAES